MRERLLSDPGAIPLHDPIQHFFCFQRYFFLMHFQVQFNAGVGTEIIYIERPDGHHRTVCHCKFSMQDVFVVFVNFYLVS